MPKFKQIIEEYIVKYRPGVEEERLSFVKEVTLVSAISRAALCKLATGNRHSHQYRIPLNSLKEAEKRLLKQRREIKNAKTFDELHDLVNKIIRGIWMIGELVVYDTSTRIGAFLRLDPSTVYLHRGTREGARALLEVSRSQTMLHPHELPREFSKLQAYEIEDVLCRYKEHLKGLKDVRPGRCSGPIDCSPRSKTKRSSC